VRSAAGPIEELPDPNMHGLYVRHKASHKKWRDKPTNKAKLPSILQAGQRVSVNQKVSPIPGLIAQITGILTMQRYKYATVFVDQAMRMGYVHLQKYALVEEMLDVKEAFKAYASTHGISTKAYHVDNGIFKANKWVESCKKASQGLSFASVNSHHENSIAERRIKEIQDTARTMLIHASRR
jgi:flagellar basal body rod protein FlgC